MSRFRGNSSGPFGGSGSHEDPVVELENQFLLRLPEEPAAALREALRAGAGNLRERLLLQLEPDPKNPTGGHLRRGQLQFDGWSMKGKLVDLPTILESQKTMDKKTFYKTADISQMLICKEQNEDDDDSSDSDDDNEEEKPAKRDPNKVDKKYLHAHGVCPPLKNCRRRRFRKTLKKKTVDAPEIEKEVKRLLQVDQDAVEVKWDLVATEDEVVAPNQIGGGSATMGGAAAAAVPAPTDAAPGPSQQQQEQPQPTAGGMPDAMGIAHDDLFGDLSEDSDDEHGDKANTTGDASEPPSERSERDSEPNPVAQHLENLRRDIAGLRTKKHELERNIETCDNAALLARFKESLAMVEAEIKQKQEECEGLEMFS